MEKFKTFLKDNWVVILLILGIIGMFIFGNRAWTNYKNEQTISHNNITALMDSIKYYKGVNDNLCVEKSLLIGDMKTLKLAYKELDEELSNMKIQNASMAMKISSLINNPTHDTTWHIVDSCVLHEQFNFDDMPYRKLSGNIDLENNEISMKIDTDQVYLDLVVAIEDNNVKVTSNNPYLSFEELYGINNPTYEPSWCLVAGPYVGLGVGSGYNFFNNQKYTGLVGSVGISLTFGWNIAGVGKRIKK